MTALLQCVILIIERLVMPPENHTYKTVAEIKKERERETRIQALIDQADEWPREQLLDYAKDQLRQDYDNYTDKEIDQEYNEEFSEGDGM